MPCHALTARAVDEKLIAGGGGGGNISGFGDLDARCPCILTGFHKFAVIVLLLMILSERVRDDRIDVCNQDMICI